MRAKALSVFVANTQKILKESERKGKADDQAEKMENFVKNLTMEVNNMLARFYFQKEHEQMTDDQRKALVDFVNFVKTLIKSVQSLLRRYQKSQTFEEKLDKEIKELEDHVKQKLKEFDEALSETSDTLTNHLSKYVCDIAAGIRGRLKALALVCQRRKLTRENTGTTLTVDNKINLDVSSSLTKPLAHNIKEDSLTGPIDSRDSKLETLFDGPNMININEANSDSEKSERQIRFKV